MKKTFYHWRVLIWGLVVLLLAIPIKTDAGSPIDGQLVISADAEQEVQPSIAYNSQRQEYLVVWYNDRPGCDDVRAQRVSRTGELLGGPFYISAGCPADRRYPDVTYNSRHDQYLVVWEQYEATSGKSIKARRVSGTGQVLDTTDITIRSAGYNTYTPVKPAAAYAYTADRYLVVWAETWHPLPIVHDVYGQVVTDSGALDGNRFSISEGTGNDSRDNPDVTYNRHANRYLVVWQQKVGSLWDVHGQQVHGGGGLYQGDITIAYYTVSSTTPAVAAIPTTPNNDKFLVVWEANLSSHRDIYGRLIAEDGTLAPSALLIAWTGVDQSAPAVAGNEGGNRYLVTWRQDQGAVDKPIYGRSIAYDGTFQDTFDIGGPATDYPAVAAGPTGDFFVAWQDQPVWATNTNIYGQLWGSRVYLPLVLRNYQ